MNIKEAYNLFEGNYEEILGRLRKNEVIIKFLKEIQEEKLLDNIASEMKNKDDKMIFLSAHTLKGIAKNLNLHKLEVISSEFTDFFREPKKEVSEKTVINVFNNLKSEYEKTMDIIQQIE